VGKDLYWVALITSLFFKWMNNQEGTVGYVMVSTNERDVIGSRILAEKTSRLNQSEAFFGSQIEGHLYF
jgi:hypothetical protein